MGHNLKTFIFAGFSCLFFMINAPASLALPAPAGQVVFLQGGAKKNSRAGKSSFVKQNDAVYEGDSIETTAGANLRIVLRDKSVLHLGPSSKIKIDEFVNNEPGLISLFFGQLRSRVSKSINGNVKMLLKTPSSVMGVRGTDFHTVYNEQRKMTLLVTYEGAVAMANGEKNTGTSSELIGSLQDQSRSVLVERGQFSGISAGLETPTVPVKISPAQLDSLRTSALGGNGNQSAAGGAPQNSQQNSQGVSEKVISLVPPGVNPKTVAESEGDLNAALQKSAPGIILKNEANALAMATPPEGLLDPKTGRTVPPAGGFIDFKTGLYIPPPPGSSYDVVAGVYVPAPTVAGGFQPETGAYVAPAGGDARTGATLVAAESKLLPGLRAETMGAGMVAAPLDSGANIGESLTRPMAFRPASAAYYEGGVLGGLPPRPGSQYPGYDGVQPRFPVYDPSVCPPYCDPRYQPGLYPAMPYRQPTSAVTVIISV